ncbi:MAG: cation/H(+) antiporter [Archangium gephyra]|uniref:Cation/H(+) antiporter n=1 Tax=Archangium gephyra TaxID=48 RepID=A0A2W5SL51_9BACT|nr:MAG: cation/H(+) antiporter [Archangium gephyra]
MPHFEFSALTLLLAQMAVVLLVSRLLGVVAKWLGQPMVIAEVVAGIVLGPSLLGWLWPEGMQMLFPDWSMSVLKMLSQVGLVLFMFLVGLELDPRLLKGRTHASVAISHTSIIVPFLLGAGAAYFFYDTYSSPDVSLLSFVLFLGIAMSITAFPVLARILSERNLLTSRVGAIAIACAAVDDVTAWCLLAFVVAVARATGLGAALWTTGMALAFIGFMLLVVRPFLARLGSRVADKASLTPTVMALSLLMLMVSAWTTEVIGIHALFGAFMFGAVLPKDGRFAEALAERIETVAVTLLLPLFFAFSGLRTQIGLVNAPSEWLVTGVIIALATLGKFGGSAVVARLTGMRWREASAVGILMNTRGLMELIVLNIGLDLGVISPTVFTMLVIMALVTTFATTPVLNLVYPPSELAKDRLVGATPTPMPGLPGAAPPFTVLMCVSDAAAGPGLATVSAALLGKREEPAHLLALHLWRPGERPSVDRRRGEERVEDGPLKPLLDKSKALSLAVRPLAFISADPAKDICSTAEVKQASLVLLGAHKPLWLEGRLGGTVTEVVTSSQRPVAVLVDRGLLSLQRVLVAYAGGPEDRAALELARRLGRTPGVSLTLLHVVPPGRAAQPGQGRAQVAEVVSHESIPNPELDALSLQLKVVEHESPAEAVLAEAKDGYDLLVLGMNPRWGLDEGFISIRRRRVLAESKVSILVVHPPIEENAPVVDAPRIGAALQVEH